MLLFLTAGRPCRLNKAGTNRVPHTSFCCCFLSKGDEGHGAYVLKGQHHRSAFGDRASTSYEVSTIEPHLWKIVSASCTETSLYETEKVHLTMPVQQSGEESENNLARSINTHDRLCETERVHHVTSTQQSGERSECIQQGQQSRSALCNIASASCDVNTTKRHAERVHPARSAE